MGAERQKIQMELAFMAEGRGEAPMAVHKGTEASLAKREPEDPALAVLLMEQICQRENSRKALQRVRQNKGSPGIDGIFDRVNHDKLMGHLAKRIGDKRLLKVIRAFLNAGVMENGLVSATTEGAPQGGPLSPLLSNVVLDELDRELERRGHRFIRYADDCNIYVRSERAGRRVMETISQFITRKLKLKVNPSKSKVDRPWRCKFLGFRIIVGKETKRSIAPGSLSRFKERVRKLTCYRRPVPIEQMIERLNRYVIGWRGYFGYCQSPSVLRELDGWIRRRLRCVCWRRWKRGTKRFAELRRLGVGHDLAAQTAGSIHGPWRISRSPALSYALPNAHFNSLGLALLAE